MKFLDNPSDEIIKEIVSRDIEEMLRKLRCEQTEEVNKENYEPDKSHQT